MEAVEGKYSTKQGGTDMNEYLTVAAIAVAAAAISFAVYRDWKMGRLSTFGDGVLTGLLIVFVGGLAWIIFKLQVSGLIEMIKIETIWGKMALVIPIATVLGMMCMYSSACHLKDGEELSFWSKCQCVAAALVISGGIVFVLW